MEAGGHKVIRIDAFGSPGLPAHVDPRASLDCQSDILHEIMHPLYHMIV